MCPTKTADHQIPPTSPNMNRSKTSTPPNVLSACIVKPTKTGINSKSYHTNQRFDILKHFLWSKSVCQFLIQFSYQFRITLTLLSQQVELLLLVAGIKIQYIVSFSDILQI